MYLIADPGFHVQQAQPNFPPTKSTTTNFPLIKVNKEKSEMK
jgi:hypothetical protein